MIKNFCYLFWCKGYYNLGVFFKFDKYGLVDKFGYIKNFLLLLIIKINNQLFILKKKKKIDQKE